MSERPDLHRVLGTLRDIIDGAIRATEVAKWAADYGLQSQAYQREEWSRLATVAGVCTRFVRLYEAELASVGVQVRSCLRCHSPIFGMAVWLFVNGRGLPVDIQDKHVFCVDCGSNGKNGITKAEYDRLIQSL